MPRVNVNLSDSKGFDPVPAGPYNVSITKAEPRQTAAGQAALNWTLTIQEGDFTGQNLFLFTMLEGKGTFKTKELLIAAGLDCSEDQLDFDTDDLLGIDITVTVSQEMVNGRDGETKIVNKIDSILPYQKKSRK